MLLFIANDSLFDDNKLLEVDMNLTLPAKFTRFAADSEKGFSAVYNYSNCF